MGAMPAAVILAKEDDESCGLNLKCHGTKELAESLSGAVNDTLENLATAIGEAVGEAAASLGTAWLFMPTADLVGGKAGGPQQYSAERPPSEATAGLVDVLGWTMWISLGICVLSLIVLGAMMAVRTRQGEGSEHLGKIVTVLAASVLIGAASAIATALLNNGPAVDGTGTVVWIQRRLWFYVGFAVVLSVIVGAARMAWEQRADPGKDLLKSLLTLVVVTGAGLTVLGVGIGAADSFTEWLVLQGPDADFGKRVLQILGLAGPPGFGVMMAIVLGLVALITSIAQIVLLVVRDGLLIIIAGTLPVAAAMTNTEIGRNWFKKYCGWTLAFILYKPAAAIIYAAAFQVVGADGDTVKATVLNVLIGMALMFMALMALPALMKLVAPAASLGGGDAAVGAMVGAATAVAGQVPSGAINKAHEGSQSGGGIDTNEGSDSSGAPQGADSAPAPSQGSEGTGQPTGGDTGGVGGGGDDASAGPGPSGSGTPDAQASQGSAATQGGSEAAGADPSGADPYTAAIKAGVEVGQAAKGGAEGTMDEAAEGPDGSR